MEDGQVFEEDGEGNEEDIALQPSANADPQNEIEKYIRRDVLEKYDVYSYRHAAAILKSSFPDELQQIENALLHFTIQTDDFAYPGGNESIMPKKFSLALRPLNWNETRIQGDLTIQLLEYSEKENAKGRLVKFSLPEKDPITIEKYIDGHKIDYVKGQVAFDLEWNSKDQTFDRDLYAFRMFHECGVISVAIIVTRSEKLNSVFSVVPVKDKDGNTILENDGTLRSCKYKFGASTTWMGKLLYRLNAGRHGGCPVLVFGIRPDIITDWPAFQEGLI
jgi:hypothetical protein